MWYDCRLAASLVSAVTTVFWLGTTSTRSRRPLANSSRRPASIRGSCELYVLIGYEVRKVVHIALKLLNSAPAGKAPHA